MKGDFLLNKLSFNSKKRYFAFLLYPESINSEWKQILINLKQRVFYIYHDKDIILETGEVKKPHYHVMIMYDSPRSDATVSKIATSCGSNGHLERIESKSKYMRYLIHLDNPEKYQYGFEDVVSLGGADYVKEIRTKLKVGNDKLKIISEMINFCNDNNIEVYADFLSYCVKYRQDWLKILTSYSGRVIENYIKSSSWAKMHAESLGINRFYS